MRPSGSYGGTKDQDAQTKRGRTVLWFGLGMMGLVGWSVVVPTRRWAPFDRQSGWDKRHAGSSFLDTRLSSSSGLASSAACQFVALGRSSRKPTIHREPGPGTNE